MRAQLRRKPLNHDQFKLKSKRLPWRRDMTLCIAAACWEAEEEPRIIICSETRVESGWAGAKIAHKHAWITPHWQALMAGELSKAEDFAATCTETLKAGVFSSENIFDRLNEASAKHKAKLCER